MLDSFFIRRHRLAFDHHYHRSRLEVQFGHL
jgi:hypothetical protein